MSYEEWLKNIEILKENNNEEIKNKLLNDENINLKEMLEGKLIELIKYKFVKTTNKIIKNLVDIFSDDNILDMYLVNLKKELRFIYELTFLKQISNENQEYIRTFLKKEVNNIYNILINEARSIDTIGNKEITIKNNMFKWE